MQDEAIRSLAARGAAGLGLVGAGLGVRSALKGKEKSAAEIAREKILLKLAGEDVMKAMTPGGSADPLVGGGELAALESSQVRRNPTDGAGYGNQQRRMIASNDAAIGVHQGRCKKATR